jgi:hypothetical protein
MGSKMKCNEAGPLISAFIDNELTGSEKELLSTHIRQCAKCRAELEVLSALKGSIQRPIITAERPFFETRLLNRIKQNESTASVGFFIASAKKLMYVAATVFALFTLFNYKSIIYAGSQTYTNIEEYILQSSPKLPGGDNEILTVALKYDTEELNEVQ